MNTGNQFLFVKIKEHRVGALNLFKLKHLTVYFSAFSPER